MDKDFQNIFNKAKQIKLSSTEKDNMRMSLDLFTRAHPVRNAGTGRLLLRAKSKSYISAFAEIFSLKSLTTKPQFMAIALIIALLIGGGTSFAAERALPGDILYPVKVGVNEEVRSFVAFTNQAQAELDTQLAQRRLEEAEKLASEGRLNTKVRADLESRFEGHAQAFEDQAKKIDSKQSTNTSLEVNSDFETALKAHEQVLGQIANGKADTRIQIEPLLLKVRARLGTAVKARSNVEARVSAEADGEFKASSAGKLKAAENKVDEVRRFVTQIKASVSADSYVQAEAQLNTAENVIARGKTEVEAQTYGKAFASFQEAIRIAQEAKLLVAAEDENNIEIKVQGLKIKDDNESDGSLHIKGESKDKSEDATPSVDIKSHTEMETGDDYLEKGGDDKVNGKVKINIGL